VPHPRHTEALTWRPAGSQILDESRRRGRGL